MDRMLQGTDVYLGYPFRKRASFIYAIPGNLGFDLRELCLNLWTIFRPLGRYSEDLVWICSRRRIGLGNRSGNG